jgi:hypothetical protein
MTAWGLLETGPGEISLYYSEHYSTPKNQLRRATLRTDGFVSVHAPAQDGEFITRPLTFAGKALVLSYSTSAAGSVQVEIQDQTASRCLAFIWPIARRSTVMRLREK